LVLGVHHILELLSWFACFTQGSAETQDSPCFVFSSEVSDVNLLCLPRCILDFTVGFHKDFAKQMASHICN